MGNPNTIQNNRSEWSEWDWSSKGEEWSNTPEWKQSLLVHVLLLHLKKEINILEIGPGAGRWTETLLQYAKNLTVVDLVPKCIELCQERFKEFKHIDYHINDGKDLSFVPDHSIHFIWSWDVFVHIKKEDIRDYVKQFARIMAPGAKAIIHHSKNGTSNIGWRSDMTQDLMRIFCEEFGLNIIEQFDSWDNNSVHIWPNLPPHAGPDITSVITKP